MNMRLWMQFVKLCAAGLVAAAMSVTVQAPTPASAREMVNYKGQPIGTIVVMTSQRRLYYVVEEGKAIRYPVGVGRAGRQWSGVTSVTRKQRNPAWGVPPEIRKDRPKLPAVIPAGSPQNPLGVAALELTDNYGIHGTNDRSSIGRFVSYGCIRMFNDDITDLYDRVSVGTRVVVSP
jgi:lipoprotein-anchoring transpeptidase ErfK/SrfK